MLIISTLNFVLLCLVVWYYACLKDDMKDSDEDIKTLNWKLDRTKTQLDTLTKDFLKIKDLLGDHNK